MKVSAVVSLIRPRSWVKNVLVFAALIFSGKFMAPGAVLGSLSVFGAFCSLSSAGYVLNDWVDRERDRRHPDKADRPLASGTVGGMEASAVGILLLIATGGFIWLLPPGAAHQTALVCTIYFLLMIGYNLGLKHVFGVELLIIAVGFLLRAIAGGVGIQVPLTNWFLIAIFFLCLMVVVGKRRHERLLLEDKKGEHRPVLEQYQPRLLDAMINISGGTALVTYTLWTVNGMEGNLLAAQWLPVSVIFVVFGLMRYLYCLYSGQAGTPEKIFLRDVPMLVCVLAWGAFIVTLFFV